jgi:BMFP domain-containing protein YqiC
MSTLPPERPRLLDDLAGLAGGAVSALAGLRDEAEAMVRAKVDEALRRLDLVRREEFEVVSAMAARAREAQEQAEVRLSALEARLAELTRKPGGGGPGMIA